MLFNVATNKFLKVFVSNQVIFFMYCVHNNEIFVCIHYKLHMFQVEDDLKRLRNPTQLQLPIEQIQAKPWCHHSAKKEKKKNTYGLFS